MKKTTYADAVIAAGGVPYTDFTDVNCFDGLLLCGGADISPEYYQQSVNGSVNIDLERDKKEFALLKEFVASGKAVLGICRGCQLINVFFGGSLYQHISTASDHISVNGVDALHPVRAEKNSVAEMLYGSNFAVNSSHHQSVDRLGDGLRITMVSESDGIVEGIEHTTLPIIAFQWHPERLCGALRRDPAVDGAPVFKHFIDMCKKG